MPMQSEQQRKAMYAAAAGHSTLGIPQSVGKEFVRHDSDTNDCAGILFKSGNEFLLVRRADNGVWEQPGGHIQIGEVPEEAAIRECIEEIGSCPYGIQYLLSVGAKDGGGTYSTYRQDVEKFDVKLNHESTESGWFTFETLPTETRPCVLGMIRALSGNELDIARAIQSGALSSPQQYENIWLFDVRVTGTGTSYRQALEEYVYRPPENFLTDDFLQRCNGLPLIFEHPDKSLLNSDEYKERSIGNVILPYIKENEVWGIAKVYDDAAAQLMQTTHKSTSPAVVFRKIGSTETIELDDGKSVLIEGVPSYLDHLAVCMMGVWDKGGDPTGINLGAEIMADEKAPVWADALMKRMDSIEEGMKADKARKDSEEEEAKKKADSAKSEDEMKADKARKDSEETEEKEKLAKADKARKDAEEFADAAIKMNDELKAQMAEVQAQMAILKQPLSATDRDMLSKAQARADSVAQMFGDSAAAPLHGETPINYRKRLAAKIQKHSKDFAEIKLDSLEGAVFDQIESKIYADAQAHAMSPAVAVKGRMIPHVRTDSAGRQITSYTGDPDAWMSMFKSKPVFITGINREGAK